MLLHTTLDDEFVRYSGKTTEHSHLPNPAEGEIRDLREKMRERAETELRPLQEIAEQEVRRALLSEEALAVLPAVTTIDRFLRFFIKNEAFSDVCLAIGHSLVRARRRVTRVVPQSSSFTIPFSYTRDHRDRERLLLHDSHDPHHQNNLSGNVRSAGRVLVWATDTQLNLLFDSDRLHMDRTFSSAPSIFNQVYIIQAFLHGTCKLSLAIKPLVIFFL